MTMIRYSTACLITSCCLLAVGGTEARAADPAGVRVLRPGAAPADATGQQLVDPAHAAWSAAPAQTLQLHRTPQLHAPGERDDGARPVATVRLLKLGGGALALRLEWTDATQDLDASSARFPDQGDKGIYKRHSHGVSRFADAACVMLPRRRGPHERYPSLMMGDRDSPAELYYWRASKGFSLLRAAGRSTLARTATTLQGAAAYKEGRWSAIFILPGAPARTPLSFAIWDGAKAHRDGIKYFSIWYELG